MSGVTTTRFAHVTYAAPASCNIRIIEISQEEHLGKPIGASNGILSSSSLPLLIECAAFCKAVNCVAIVPMNL